MRARTAEVAAAIGAATFGAASIAFVLFVPLVSTMSGTSGTVAPDGSMEQTGQTIRVETHSLAEDGLAKDQIAALLLLVLLFATLVVTAILHGRARALRSSLPIWTPAVVLCAFVFLTGFSIGLIFLPSAVLALVAAVAATRYAHNLRLTAIARI